MEQEGDLKLEGDGEGAHACRKYTKQEKRAYRYEQVKLKNKADKQTSKRARKQAFDCLSEQQKHEAKARRAEEVERQKENLARGVSSGVRVVLDLCYEEEHCEREVKSLARQVRQAYAVLKRSPRAVCLQLAGLQQPSLTFTHLQLQGMSGWGLLTSPQSVEQLHPPDSLVYLSPDAKEALDTLQPDKVYVVGGVVDRQVRKSASQGRAEGSGLTTRRLPLQEVIPGRVSHVLNVDTVVEILCRFSESQSWRHAMQCVPLRRRGHPTPDIHNPEIHTSDIHNSDIHTSDIHTSEIHDPDIHTSES